MAEKRRHKPKVTKADYNRLADFLRLVGAKVAMTEITPGGIKIVTTEGRGLTLHDDQESLDAELAEHQRAHGYG